MSIVIGLTGPTGAGKSSVTAVAERMGFKIIDCDRLARIATEKGSDGLNALVGAFGENILEVDGTLNRAALAKVAFCTPDKTELLNKTLLPHIVKLIKAQIDKPLVLLDAPTLFESGADSLCDTTVAVLCDTDTRLVRIMNRDGIDRESALLRINAGKSDKFYMEKAKHIVYNESNLSVFEQKIEKILNDIMEENKNV